MNHKPFSTIIFDLSEVLITGLLDIEIPLSHLLRVPPEGLLSAFGGQPLNELFCGRITETDFLAEIIEKQMWNISEQELQSLIRQNFHHRIPGMREVTTALANQYELVLLSDHAREWVTYIMEIHPFLDAFKHQFYSYQLGQTKKEASTFTKVLNAIRKCPEQCLFIDDSPINVAVAESVGIHGIQFFKAEDLIRKLDVLRLLDSLGAATS